MTNTKHHATSTQFQREAALFASKGQPELATILHLTAEGIIDPASLDAILGSDPAAKRKRNILSCPYLARFLVDTHTKAEDVVEKMLASSQAYEVVYQQVVSHLRSKVKDQNAAEWADLRLHKLTPSHAYHLSNRDVEEVANYAQQAIIGIIEPENLIHKPRVVSAPLKKTPGS